ncbi:MAG: efflux RND transporter periplasmic adaptor subunit [Bacteroidia bacterium]|nr:efflux RND transporter periplasmic adaptor subunit [Bacteroidia bacterium]
MDISKVTKGLKVEIKADAFSDSVYNGEVLTVANLAINKDGTSKIKVFPVDILIKDAGKKLLPGLSVSCRLLIRKINNVVFIPIDGVQTNGLEEFVYIKTKEGFKKVVVVTGVSNTDHIVITKGLKAGDVVAMADPYAVQEVKGAKESNKTQKEKAK